MARLMIRPDVLERIKESRGIATDKAMADIGHVSLSTYQRYRDRKTACSSEFLACICLAFGMGPGEIAQVDSDLEASEVEPAA